MRSLLLRALTAVSVLVVVAIPLGWLVGGDLVEPLPHNIGRPPLDLEASNVTLASASGTLIHGWLSHGTARHGVVLLLHGLHGDRRSMLGRAEFLHKQGYTVLLIDFQAHGESKGRRLTFGDLESRDVVAAIQYLNHQLPDERVGVIGVSLGAAAFALADDRPPVAAVVLESMYPTLEEAVADRLRAHLGPFGSPLAPLLFMQMRPRLEIEPARLRPIDGLGRIGAPVLIVGGTRDPVTTLQDTRAIFSVAGPPKELWEVQDARHVDLYQFGKTAYEQRIGVFLNKYLPQDSDAAIH